MPITLPMLQSYKNVAKLFEKIKAAKQPEAFTHKFLRETLGLKSVGDRPLIAFLRTLGFLDSSNKPTVNYARLKNDQEVKKAIAQAIKGAYAPLFTANENAHTLPQEQLRGLIAQVAGTDASNTSKILGTLNALLKLADFSEQPRGDQAESSRDDTSASIQEEEGSSDVKLRTEFHYNIQIHLPANGSEEMYLNIFNALRKVFK